MQKNQVFALDIGTRSVVGLIAELQDDLLQIIDLEVKEHPERSMIDGQIHDIPKVAKTVVQIKSALENRLNISLTEVAVAAAGRSLLTAYGRADLNFPIPKQITSETLYALQLEAVHHAQSQMNQLQKPNEYHCVGYSVLHQYLDEIAIGNLVGQSGKQAAVEVIATFLPRVVIDSLHAVLQQADLEMAYLTLEPIAAINVAIPENMRQLNLALVDIGAGTSDIAISNKGAISGYAMVPIAGDEITEALCDLYLLDFQTGEEVKRKLNSAAEEIIFNDIVGFECRYQKQEIVSSIDATINQLAQKIAIEITDLNNKSPQAVLCIGGGSLTPLLANKIAANLQLPKSRVAVKGYELAKTILKITDKLAPPQIVTPVGIARDALLNRALDLITVTVNERPIRLFEIQMATVGDALISSGIDPSQYLARIGPALTLEVNGKLRFIKGQPGKGGKIVVNGNEGDLTTPIKENDRIEFTPGVNGKPGIGTVRDLLPQHLIGQYIYVNNKKLKIIPEITLNDRSVSPDDNLTEGCRFNYTVLTNIQDVLDFLGYNLINFRVEVDVNGVFIENWDSPINNQDRLEISKKPLEDKTVKNQKDEGSITVSLNSEEITIPARSGVHEVIFTDIFNFIKLEPKDLNGSKMIMEVNGQKAGFMTPLKEGDAVKIIWEDKEQI